MNHNAKRDWPLLPPYSAVEDALWASLTAPGRLQSVRRLGEASGHTSKWLLTFRGGVRGVMKASVATTMKKMREAEEEAARASDKRRKQRRRHKRPRPLPANATQLRVDLALRDCLAQPSSGAPPSRDFAHLHARVARWRTDNGVDPPSSSSLAACWLVGGSDVAELAAHAIMRLAGDNRAPPMRMLWLHPWQAPELHTAVMGKHYGPDAPPDKLASRADNVQVSAGVCVCVCVWRSCVH